ncbi:MAG: carbamoyl-phosphate synthase large subunit [Ruminococcaceae bacterium]|nr:carbamoyl-phosphate synthase large subunit [Oscillospiraceae bacterium]
MPLDKNIRRTLVIGSGPIVIGQAAEFDYAGTQACQALRAEGIEVILVNSNPATIMTDENMADHIYIEPLTLPVLKRIIEKEKPDSILPSLGGQTGLTFAMQLAREGFLEKHNVRLLGTQPDAIDKAEDRQMFKDAMAAIGQPCIPSDVTEELEGALAFAKKIGYPVIVRPAFTMGGSGGGRADNEDELREIAGRGLAMSPIHQILVEQCISGWKEIEFEVMRDSAGNCITICSMENIDPVGVHTGDSTVVAPALTLADKEYQMLRSAALKIIDSLGIAGGCNCQFALHPESFEYAVIEVNPRVSRSSALASKATGYPIARVAAKIAIGYTLPELPNLVTGGKTCACFEPAIDYVVVKLARWPFDKFVYAQRTLGTQMKATGEVMSIGATFEEAMMKAVRGAEIGLHDLNDPLFAGLDKAALEQRLYQVDDKRLFCLYAALKAGISVETIHEITTIDRFFINKLHNIAKMEAALAAAPIDDTLYLKAKRMGFPDRVIEKLSGQKVAAPRLPVYKMVDTCAAEFRAETPYFYATYEDENEAEEFLAGRPNPKDTVVVFGSGPIRIGQGIEFDYASVHCVWALRKQGYEVVIVNNNPETVSTDFDTADRLYFEPLTPEDVMGVLAVEKPVGVVVAFGGQTAIKLTNFLQEQGITILGTPADSIDAAEDRERFDALLTELDIARPRGQTVLDTDEALCAAGELGYPVLLRPSYVLGGQNMIIAFEPEDIKEYMAIILAQGIQNPILIDQYLMGTELEVDAICDGEDILIPGVMEHVERAGVHSGDSIAVYPSWNVDDVMLKRLVDCSRALALGLKVKGLVNIQYLIFQDELYVIEVNPRSSRTIPYISKVTGVPMVDLATRAMLGEKLADMGYGTGLYPIPPYVAVKVPVFSFEKLADVDTALGPEMKSTGEVLGLASTLSEALYKGLIAAGYKMDRPGGVFFSVKKSDRRELFGPAKRFLELGHPLYATEGNAGVLRAAGLPVTEVAKLSTGSDEILQLMETDRIAYVVSTSSKGRLPTRDGVRIRRKAVEKGIPCLTSIDTAVALADSMESRYSQQNIELIDLNRRRTARHALRFAKMQATGNDYICFDCRDQQIDNPAGLAIRLASRHYGIGGEGVVLLYPSTVADFKMVMYNLDGTPGGSAGNATRLLAKYAYERGVISKLEATVETDFGIRQVWLSTQNGMVHRAAIDMGQVKLAPADVPVMLPGERIVDHPVNIGRGYNITCINVGNPHAVAFVDALDIMDLETEGRAFEEADIFPQRVNAEFVQVLDETTLRMRVWERGNGETWACGTGACAAVVAAVLNGICAIDTDITVKLLGGEMRVRYCTDGTVRMAGGVDLVYEGEVKI